MTSLFTEFKGRALWAGIAIAAIQLALGYLGWYLQRSKGTTIRRVLRRYRRSVWRQFVNPALMLIWSLGAPLLALYLGIFSTQDIGIPLPDWHLTLPWTGATLAVSVVWIGWLWGRHWLRHPDERPDIQQSEQFSNLAGLLAHVLSQEGYSASARAALIPVCGRYWGVWAGILAKIGITVMLPATRAGYRSTNHKDIILLDWASDLVCAALFVLTGSIILTTILRLVLVGILLLLMRFLPWKKKLMND